MVPEIKPNKKQRINNWESESVRFNRFLHSEHNSNEKEKDDLPAWNGEWKFLHGCKGGESDGGRHGEERVESRSKPLMRFLQGSRYHIPRRRAVVVGAGSFRPPSYCVCLSLWS